MRKKKSGDIKSERPESMSKGKYEARGKKRRHKMEKH